MDNKIFQKIFGKKNEWMLAEDIPDVYFHFAQIFLSSFVNDMEKTVGLNYKTVLTVFHGQNLKFYYEKRDSQKFSAHVIKLIIKSPTFGKKINTRIESFSKKLKYFCREINPGHLKNVSGRQLAGIFDELDEIHTELYSWGWLPNAVDMFHNDFTDYLKEILRKKIPVEKINEALVILSVSPRKSIVQKEHESFLRLVILRQNKAPKEIFYSAVKKHLAKFFYLKYLWLGKEGVYDWKYYFREIDNFLKSKKNAKEILSAEQANFLQNIKKRKALIEKIKLSQKEKQLFDVYADFAVTKLIRRDAQIFWAYKMGFLFSDLVRRLRIPLVSARFMLPEEIRQALSSEKLNPAMRKELKKRSKFCIYYAEKERDFIFTGLRAKKIEKALERPEKKSNKELSGQTACLGRATGKAKVVNLISEMEKMRKGDILVSIATNPDIVPAMKLAAAIVTEQGGITSHAAIVSREMKIPCIIGVKSATKVLHDGDLVEVDANRGLVRIVKKA